MVSSHSQRIYCNGKQIRSRVEVTGIQRKGRRQGITAMFDGDENTFWHGTRLTPEFRSAVRITFKVSYINNNPISIN